MAGIETLNDHAENTPDRRIAFVHDWMFGYAGSERTVDAAMAAWPDAPLFTLAHNPDAIAGTGLAQRAIHNSFLQRMPGIHRRHRWYLPLMPLAVEQFDLRGYDVVVSSNHAVAKGVLTGADQLHISYMHTPIRYAWDLYHEYLAGSGAARGLRGVMMRAVLHYLRLWDVAAANRVDRFVANSHFVARRIRKTYRREAEVIHPPVDVQRFRADRPREDFYLAVGRMVPYKRVELIVEAFKALDRPLVVIGDGPQWRRVAAEAGPHVQLLGEQPDAVVTDYLERCRAMVFAAEEDFGIVPVEMKSRPVTTSR